MSQSDISIKAYSPQWAQLFAKEAHQLYKLLGSNCTECHHIGSTAISGLASKPIIDILPVVRCIKQVDSLNNRFIEAGYEVKGEFGIPFRRYFKKQAFNIHIYEVNNPEITRHLKFRDWLRTHPQDRNQYEQLKIQLAAIPQQTIGSYVIGKEPFINSILEKAGFNDYRITQTLTPYEWQTYHQICEQQIFSNIDIVYDPNHISFKQPNHFRFCLYLAIHIVAIAHVEIMDDSLAALRVLAVDTHKQKKGHGRYLLQQMERWLSMRSIVTIKLHADLTAEDFYRNLGYHDVEFSDCSISENTVKLGKILK